MPKRHAFVVPQIADMDNLRLAFWKAQRGKETRVDVQDYRRQLQQNLLSLQSQIQCGEVIVGNYRYFKVFDPKERQICSAVFAERVLHHAIMNICHSHFESYQIYDSYASRKGKGQYAALARAKLFCKRYPWYLKLDVRKYFDSISHFVLNQQLLRLYKDKYLLNIFRTIINTNHVQPNKGLPIGNLTSQYFANHYLSLADHYAQEVLQVPAYVRYMDDMVIWHSDKNALLQIAHQFEQYLNQTLQLQLKPVCLNQTGKGLPYLGYIVYPHKVSLSHRSRFRYIRKLSYYNKQLTEGIWSQDTFARHVAPLTAFVQHADSLGFRNKIIQKK